LYIDLPPRKRYQVKYGKGQSNYTSPHYQSNLAVSLLEQPSATASNDPATVAAGLFESNDNSIPCPGREESEKISLISPEVSRSTTNSLQLIS